MDAALDELVACAGSQFDPQVVTAIVAVMRQDAPSTRLAGAPPARSAVLPRAPG